MDFEVYNENLPEQYRKLAYMMSEISEDCWCAGWIAGLEFSLWEMVSRGETREWGQSMITRDELSKLKAESDKIGGWIAWDKAVGERFLPTDEWIRLFDDHNRELDAWIEEMENNRNA